jgi:hypothetical protein
MMELIHKPSRVLKKNSKGKRGKRRYGGGVYSSYLFPEPNVWDGVASTFDLFGVTNNQFNYSRSERGADARGLRSDCYAIAHDFWHAVRLFEGEHSLEELPKQQRLFDPDEQYRLFDPDKTTLASDR